MAVAPAPVAAPKRGTRIGDLLQDANKRPLIDSASQFTENGRKLLEYDLASVQDRRMAQAMLEFSAKNIDRLRLSARLQDAANDLAGPTSAPDPLLDRPAIERGVAHFFAGLAGATPQFVQEGGQRVANWLYEKQTGQKIDTRERPIQRSTAAVVGPAKGAGEKLAQTAGGLVGAGAEIVTMRRLPFLASAPGASAGAQFARGAATMATFNAMAPAENWKERAVSATVGGALGGATELLPLAAYKYIINRAATRASGALAKELQQASRMLAAAATPEEQAAARAFAEKVMPKVQEAYAPLVEDVPVGTRLDPESFLRGAVNEVQGRAGAAAAPTAAKVAAGAAHVGGAVGFGVVAPVAEYWMNRATGSDVEFPTVEDMALSTGAMLASGFAGDIARRATEGGRRGAPSDALARRAPSAQAGPNGPAAAVPPENTDGVRPVRMPRPGTDMPWSFPKPGTPDAAARPGWSDPKITGDAKSPGSLRAVDVAVRKLGNEPMPTVGGRTPRESFNYYFNQAIQSFAAERGVQPEALTADEVNHALWRAVARAKGDVTLHRTMTLPPIDPADPKAGHRLEWRRKATEYANQLLAGKEVDIDLPEPGKPGSSVRGRATILRVEMDPSLRKGAVRVLVQDNGRLTPLAFDSMADFQSTMRVVPEGRPQGEQGRLTTSRLVRRPMPEPTAEGSALAAAAVQGRTVEPPAAPRLIPERSQSTLDAEGTLKKGAEFSARARALSEAFRLPGKAQTVDRRASNALLREMEAHGVKVTRAELATLRQEARVGAGQIPQFDRENWIAKRYASLLARTIEGRFGERSRAIGRRGGAPGAGAQPVGPAEPGRAIQLPAGSPPLAAGGVPASAPTQAPAPEGGQPAAPEPTSVAPAEPAPPSAAPETPAEPVAEEPAAPAKKPHTPKPPKSGGGAATPVAPEPAAEKPAPSAPEERAQFTEQELAAVRDYESMVSSFHDTKQRKVVNATVEAIERAVSEMESRGFTVEREALDGADSWTLTANESGKRVVTMRDHSGNVLTRIERPLSEWPAEARAAYEAHRAKKRAPSAPEAPAAPAGSARERAAAMLAEARAKYGERKVSDERRAELQKKLDDLVDRYQRADEAASAANKTLARTKHGSAKDAEARRELTEANAAMSRIRTETKKLRDEIRVAGQENQLFGGEGSTLHGGVLDAAALGLISSKNATDMVDELARERLADAGYPSDLLNDSAAKLLAMDMYTDQDWTKRDDFAQQTLANWYRQEHERIAIDAGSPSIAKLSALAMSSTRAPVTRTRSPGRTTTSGGVGSSPIVSTAARGRVRAAESS